MNEISQATMQQALHDLYLSHERGESDYAPFPSGWRHCMAFNTLVELGEARRVTQRPYQTFRITLLGLVVHRRTIKDAAA